MWIAYLILAIVVTTLAVKAAIKLRYGFWGAQPVFHAYDLHYWISPPGLLNEGMPSFNKYLNKTSVVTKDVREVTPADIDKFCNFIRSHYLRTRNAKYSPSNELIMTSFANNTYPSYMSVYKEPKLLFEDMDKAIPDDEWLGVITARPLTLTLKETRFPVYYVDNLCVHPDHRKRGIAPNLIQTHHYDTRHSTSEIAVHLFKREGDLTAIVPLVSYFTHMYVLPKLKRRNLPGGVTLIPVTKSNCRLALAYIHNRCSSYEAVIVPEISNILTSIGNDCLSPFLLMAADEVIGMYVFKDPAVSHGEDKALECTCCLINEKSDLSMQGFWEAVRRANRTIKARSLMIECLGDNIAINDMIAAIPHVYKLGRSPTAYFLYNYACRSVAAESTLILL